MESERGDEGDDQRPEERRRRRRERERGKTSGVASHFLSLGKCGVLAG